MDSQVIEKVDVSRIFIHRPDDRASVARVTSIEAANNVLRNWAQDTSGPDPTECEVEIVFEDGTRYYSHYPLKEQEKNVSLGRYVRRQLTALSKGKYPKASRAPANDAVIHTCDRDPAQCAQELLEHYNI